MNRNELILKLVATSHLNVPERTQLHPRTVTRKEIAQAISELLKQNDIFPSYATPVKKQDEVKEAIYDGAILYKKGNGFVVHLQESGPHGFAFRGFVESFFVNLDEAINNFMEQAYKDNIDGVYIT